MMAELSARGLDQKVYLWSDDNLSNDYFWRFLSDEERELISRYENYSRVCCFKGFDAESFSFNTLAEPALFERQFALFRKLLTTGMDLYLYVTITTPSREGTKDGVCRFIDRLQSLDENLPLRTVPLEVEVFTPVTARLDDEKREALKNQWLAVEVWQRELEDRYSHEERSLGITEVNLGRRGGSR
jgi:hypothetical protein